MCSSDLNAFLIQSGDSWKLGFLSQEGQNSVSNQLDHLQRRGDAILQLADTSLRNSSVGIMQRQGGASPVLFRSVGDLQSEVYLTFLLLPRFSLKGEPDIDTLVVLKIMLLNNTKPSDLLHWFSRVGFVWGLSPKITVSNVDVFHCI